MSRSRKLRATPRLLACTALLCLLHAAPVLAQAGASGATAPATERPAAKRIVVLDDVPYRTGASDAWLLDLALPEGFGEELRPALVIVHGGGWRAGSRRDRPYRSMLLDYALLGYVTLSIDYRLLDEAPMSGAVEDVKCAVRWLRAHAAEYRVDPDRIGVYGHSAGAHLALVMGLATPAAGMEGECEWREHSSRVTAVAGGATPTVLPARIPDAARYSPANMVSGDALPILLIHGTADEIVPVATADDFVERLKQAGAQDVTYVRIDGGNHGVAYDNYLDRSTAAMRQFFERTLGRK